jgi:four helix bundle protein
MIKTFQELIVWQKSHHLTLEIYKIVGNFPKFEEYGLANQMRRSSSSIPSNVAEGFKRRTNKDSRNFYNIASASLEELKYQVILSRDLGYISIGVFNKLFKMSEEVGKLLAGWSKSQLPN